MLKDPSTDLKSSPPSSVDSAKVNVFKKMIQKVKSWQQQHPLRFLIICFFLLLLLIFISSLLAFTGKKENQTATPQIESGGEVKALIIVETDPPSGATDVPVDKEIVFTFNEEVTIHDFEHNLFIDPAIKGEFKKGQSNQIIFVPEQSLPVGANITITISSQLRSKEGNQLFTDYTLTFSTDLTGNQVKFIEEGLSNRFMSFQTGKEAKISIESGSSVKGAVNVNIFEASLDQFLKSLIYKTKRVSSNDYAYTGDQFINSSVETYKMKKLDSKEGLKGKDSFNLDLKTGLYYLEAVNSKKERIGEVWVAFNTKGLIFRQDDQKIIVAPQNLSTSSEEVDVEISLYNLADKVTLLSKEMIETKAELSFEFPKRLDLLVGKADSEIIIVPVSVPQSQADLRVYYDLSKKNQLFLYTDRPIYKKGDKVYYRGLVRKDNDALYQLPPKGLTVRVLATRYLNDKTTVILDQKVPVLSGGVFYGEFKLNDNFGTEGQSITAEVVGDRKEDYSRAYAYFDIRNYKKPNFDIQVKTDKGEYNLKDKIQATITGSFNDGKPMAGQEVQYGYTTSTYYETDKAVFNKNFNINNWGGMCGGGFFGDFYIDSIDESSPKVKLDAQGKATVTIDTGGLQDRTSQYLVVVSFKKDSNGNKVFGASKTIVHQGDVNIFIRSRRTSFLEGEDMFASFYAETREGIKLGNKDFKYEIIYNKYEQESAKTTEQTLISLPIKTNEEGIGVIKETLDFGKVGSYILRVSGVDSKDNTVEDRRYFYVNERTENDYWTRFESIYLNVVSEKNSYKVGETAELKIESPSNVKAFVTYERGRIYSSSWLDLKQGGNILPVDITEGLSPSFTIVFSFFKDGRYYSEGLSLNVPAMHKLLNVKIKADKAKYKPGEKAKLTLTTTNFEGKAVSTRLSLSVVDKAIYTLRRDATQAIHSEFYYYRDRSTNASSSFTRIGDYGGGGGGGGGGGTLADKLVDTLYWNPNIQTNNEGSATITVPLNTYETTWRALIYASTNSTDVGQQELDFTVSD